jgi:uncharacterized RDD family membrane protein YckC
MTHSGLGVACLMVKQDVGLVMGKFNRLLSDSQWARPRLAEGYDGLLANIIDGLIFLPLSIVGSQVTNTNDKSTFIGWNLFASICWLLYSVIGHGRYGQTIGKRVMAIKVLDLDENNLIGYKRAFFRESIWFFSVIIGLAYLLISSSNSSTLDDSTMTSYGGIIGISSIIWLALELFTMLFNDKRRALHDFMAGSVVVKLDEIKRETLKTQQQEVVSPSNYS